MNLGQDYTRIWEYRERADEMDAVRIILRHNPITKATSLSVSGKEIFPPTAQFRMKNGVIGRVVIEPHSKSFLQLVSSYRYSCILSHQGKEVKLLESNELMKELDDGVTDVSVQIPQAVVDGSKTVWYLIRVRYTRVYKGQERVMHFQVHRRFRDFRFAYSQICNAFRGTHMLSSVPQHPPRHPKFLEDHLAPEFLETRRMELEIWLRKALQMPRVGINPDMEGFLGMNDPTLRETSVVVMPGETLGLRLKKRQAGTGEVFPQAAVVDFSRDADGNPGAAEVSGVVGAGDVISKIAGESVVSAVYEAIVPLLKVKPRPMIVHFIGYTFPVSKDPSLRAKIPSFTESTPNKHASNKPKVKEEDNEDDVDQVQDEDGLKDEPKDPNDVLGDETDEVKKPLDRGKLPAAMIGGPTPVSQKEMPKPQTTPQPQPKPFVASSSTSMFARVPTREPDALRKQREKEAKLEAEKKSTVQQAQQNDPEPTPSETPQPPATISSSTLEDEVVAQAPQGQQQKMEQETVLQSTQNIDTADAMVTLSETPAQGGDNDEAESEEASFVTEVIPPPDSASAWNSTGIAQSPPPPPRRTSAATSALEEETTVEEQVSAQPNATEETLEDQQQVAYNDDDLLEDVAF